MEHVRREGELLSRRAIISFGIAVLGLSALTACGPRASDAETDRAAAATIGGVEPAEIDADFATARLANDPDDPAIWVHPTDPGRSLILGTMKVAAPAGGLAVFGMDGQIRQLVTGIDRPNNVDVEYGLLIDGVPTDIAVVTERLARQLRVFTIPSNGGPLIDLGGTAVLAGANGEEQAPMGIGLYKRPRDGAIFAIVAPKAGPRQNYLWQYRLDGAGGRVSATFVRRFGSFSGATPAREDNEIEAVAVDDELGYVYYSDEGDGIHKWHADPDAPAAGSELAHFGREGFSEDREGIGIYTRPDGTGYIICTDQIAGSTRYLVYRREGEAGRPHDHSRLLAVLRSEADSTDGIEVSSRPLGPTLPEGALVAMNSAPQNFLVFNWQHVMAATPGLRGTH